MNQTIKNLSYAIIIGVFLLTVKLQGQNYPTIKIDGDEILVSDNSKFPYWLSAGQTIELGSNVKLISVIQYTESSMVGGGKDLLYEAVLTIRTTQVVPAGKVWKVESVGLDIAAVGKTATCPSANAGEVLILYNGCLYGKDVDEAGTYTWVDANKKCESYGYGWYLPRRTELEEIYYNWFQYNHGGKCYGGSCAPLVGFDFAHYWSSTVCDLYAGFALGMNFTYGSVTTGSLTNPYNVRCVRR